MSVLLRDEGKLLKSLLVPKLAAAAAEVVSRQEFDKDVKIFKIEILGGFICQ